MTNRSAARALSGCLVAAMVIFPWMVGRAADEDGERVYDGHCRQCHGPEGRGGRAPSLIPFDWTYEEALDLIRHPLCDMPPIPASALSDGQVAQIVAYLKTIK